ncbi:hypothetical protein [Dietzia massiliensis]|uniref:hypothetical protein n=1 Tax=Dietzia massiliensis TaxID=2697499 RepID=UPI003F689515
MTVRKIRAKLVLQLRAEGLSGRAIAASQGMSRKSITAVLEAADATETSWDDVAELSDEQVYTRLFPGRGEHESVFAQPWQIGPDGTYGPAIRYRDSDDLVLLGAAGVVCSR